MTWQITIGRAGGMIAVVLAGCGGLTAEPSGEAGAIESSDAGAEDVAWSTTFTVTDAFDLCTAISPQGAVAVAVETMSTDGQEDPWQLEVRLFDHGGALRWAQTIADRPQPFAVAPPTCSLGFNGEDLVLGDIRERDATQNAPISGYLARLAGSDGHMIWAKTFGEAELIRLAPIVVTPSSIIVAGSALNGDSGLGATVTDSSEFVATFDATTGALQRAAVWPGDPERSALLGITLRPDGDLSLVGSFTDSLSITGTSGVPQTLATTSASGAAFLAQFHPDLSLGTALVLDSNGAPLPGRVAFDHAGAFAAASITATSASTTTLISRFQPDGTIVSTRTSTNPDGVDESLPALTVTSNDDIVFPFSDGLSVLGVLGNEEAHLSYAGASFASLSAGSNGKAAAAGRLTKSVNFGTGVLSPASDVDTTTVFVAYGDF